MVSGTKMKQNEFTDTRCKADCEQARFLNTTRGATRRELPVRLYYTLGYMARSVVEQSIIVGFWYEVFQFDGSSWGRSHSIAPNRPGVLQRSDPRTGGNPHDHVGDGVSVNRAKYCVDKKESIHQNWRKWWIAFCQHIRIDEKDRSVFFKYRHNKFAMGVEQSLNGTGIPSKTSNACGTQGWGENLVVIYILTASCSLQPFSLHFTSTKFKTNVLRPLSGFPQGKQESYGDRRVSKLGTWAAVLSVL